MLSEPGTVLGRAEDEGLRSLAANGCIGVAWIALVRAVAGVVVAAGDLVGGGGLVETLVGNPLAGAIGGLIMAPFLLVLAGLGSLLVHGSFYVMHIWGQNNRAVLDSPLWFLGSAFEMPFEYEGSFRETVAVYLRVAVGAGMASGGAILFSGTPLIGVWWLLAGGFLVYLTLVGLSAVHGIDWLEELRDRWPWGILLDPDIIKTVLLIVVVTLAHVYVVHAVFT